MPALTPRVVWMGNPITLGHQPDPVEIVKLINELQLLASLTGAIFFEDTYTDLQAVSASDGDTGFVLSGAEQGVYRYDTDAWVLTSALPAGFVDALSAIAIARGVSLELAATRSALEASDKALGARIDVEAELRAAADASIVLALASGGTVYLSTAAGLAATEDGETFLAYVDGAISIYLNDAGIAALQGSFAPSQAFSALGWKPRASEPPHSQNKVRIAGTWYSPDPVFGLGIGQSNEKGNANATDGDKTGSGDVWVWNGTAFVEAVLGVAPFTTGAGVPNNKLFHAAHRYSVENRVPVYFFLQAVPGSGIGSWLLADPDVYPEDWTAATPGSNWLDMHVQVEAGLAHAALSLYPAEVRKIAFVSWAQGEDEYNLAPLYTLSTVRYPQLAYQVKTAPWAAQGARLVMTELLRQSAGGTAFRANEEIRKFVASGLFPNVYMLSTAQSVMTGADVGQIVHFSGASLQRQGYDLADILMGRNIGITSDGVARAIDATGQMLWKERAHSWVIELQIDASDTFPQTLTMQPTVDGLPVVFEIDGAFTEVASVNGSAVLEHDLATASTVRIWYPTDAMRDQPPGFACTAADGEGTLRSVRFNPLADLSSLFLANQPIKGRLVAATLPRSLATLRIQDAPGIIWTDFVPADLPPALTLLNFNDSLVPNHVQAAITAENVARGGTIDVQSLGIAAGFGMLDVFANVTEMTTAIGKGFSRPDGWVVLISNATAGTVATLHAKAGAPAVSGVAPAGWVLVSREATIYAPEAFGAVADGATQDFPALVSWAASGGVLQATVGKTYYTNARTATMTFAPGARARLMGATILQDYSVTSNNTVFSVGIGAVVEDFVWRITAGNYAQRTMNVKTDAVLRRVKIIADAEFPPAAVNDNYDAFISVQGTGCVLEDLEFDGVYTAIDFYSAGAPDLSNARLTNIHFHKMVKAINLAGTADGTVIDGVYVHSLGKHTDTNPGHNVVTGAAPNVVVRNVHQLFEGRGSGEHFIYMAAADGCQGVLLESIYSKGSGQCFLKFRGHDRLQLVSCHGKYTSAENAPGTNEDGLRMEYCRNAFVRDFSMRLGSEDLAGQVAGYDGIHLMHCWNLAMRDVYLDRPSRCYIHLSTSASPSADYSVSPNSAVEEVEIVGLTARKPSATPANKPFIMLGNDGGDTDVKIGNITIKELDYSGGTVADLVALQSGIATVTQLAGTRVLIDGVVDGKRVTYEWLEGSTPTIHYHNASDLTDTVANLTALTASAGIGQPVVPVGQKAYATDATAITFGSAAAGGGANQVPVWWDGTSWIIG